MPDTLLTPPTKNKGIESLSDRRLLIAGMCAVLLLSLLPRILSLRLDLQLANDQAQYASLARDYLATGSFDESLTNRSEGRYLPIGYPVLIAAASRLTGWSVDDAGALVSLLFGVLTPLLAMAIVLLASGSGIAAVGVGIVLALNYPLIFYSGTLYTESVFIFLSVVLMGLLVAGLHCRSTRGLVVTWLAMGLTFAGAFLVRSAALFLIVALPLAHLAGALRIRREERPRCWPAFAVFVTLSSAIVLWNSWRLYEWNGFFSLSPQIAGNLQVGNLLSSLDLDVVKLDPTGTRLNVHAKTLDEASAISSLLAAPWERLKLLTVNFLRNGFLLACGLAGRNKIAGGTLFGVLLLVGFAAFRGSRRAPAGYVPVADRRLEASVTSAAVLVLLHLGAYSLFMAWTRYAEQAIPWAAIAAALFLVSAAFRIRASAVWGVERFDAFVKRFRAALPRVVIPFLVIGVLAFLVVDIRRRSTLPPQAYGANRIVIYIGEAIGLRASERNEEARIATLNLGVSYYARGATYSLPFAEERPERLLTYLRHHRINFVFTDRYTGIEGQMAIGVPPYHLLELLSQEANTGVVRRFPGPFFEIWPEALPRVGEATRSEARKELLESELGAGDSLLVLRGSYLQVEGEPLAPCSAKEFLVDTAAATIGETPCLVDGRAGSRRTVVKYLWLRTGAAKTAFRWRAAPQRPDGRFQFSSLTVVPLLPTAKANYSSLGAPPGSG